MDPGVLAQVLRPLQNLFSAEAHPELLVGLGVADDAAVYRLNDRQAIISTTDFFTPVVDDPYDYGVIAAANAMSDVYAMGGEVLFALNIAAFPPDMDPALVSEILRGGADKVIEAGAIVVAVGNGLAARAFGYRLAATMPWKPMNAGSNGYEPPRWFRCKWQSRMPTPSRKPYSAGISTR